MANPIVLIIILLLDLGFFAMVTLACLLVQLTLAAVPGW